jgi:hypothetical protein
MPLSLPAHAYSAADQTSTWLCDSLHCYCSVMRSRARMAWLPILCCLNNKSRPLGIAELKDLHLCIVFLSVLVLIF